MQVIFFLKNFHDCIYFYKCRLILVHCWILGFSYESPNFLWFVWSYRNHLNGWQNFFLLFLPSIFLHFNYRSLFSFDFWGHVWIIWIFCLIVWISIIEHNVMVLLFEYCFLCCSFNFLCFWFWYHELLQPLIPKFLTVKGQRPTGHNNVYQHTTTPLARVTKGGIMCWATVQHITQIPRTYQGLNTSWLWCHVTTYPKTSELLRATTKHISTQQHGTFWSRFVVLSHYQLNYGHLQLGVQPGWAGLGFWKHRPCGVPRAQASAALKSSFHLTIRGYCIISFRVI